MASGEWDPKANAVVYGHPNVEIIDHRIAGRALQIVVGYSNGNYSETQRITLTVEDAGLLAHMIAKATLTEKFRRVTG